MRFPSFFASLFISSILVFAGCAGKTSPERIDPVHLLVSAQSIQDDINHIADSFPDRLAGTESEQNTARFVRGRFEQLGLETSEQTFSIHRYEYSQPSFVWWAYVQESARQSTQGQSGVDTSQAVPEMTAVASRPFLYSPPAGPDGVEGKLVNCQLGRVSDLAGVDVRGKVALMQRGEITFIEKALNAQRAGAIGALIYNHADDSMTGTLVQAVSIPVLGIGGLDGRRLVDLLTQGMHLQARIGLESRIVPGTSRNVSGIITASDGSKDFFIVGAHLDSVDTPGANDNASGLAAVMELARVIAAHPVKLEVRLMAFRAEEIGLRGSMETARQINAHEGKCVGMVNLDTVGTGQKLQIYTIPGGDRSLVDRMTILARQAGLSCEADQSLYSDHTAFAQAGIPAVFLMREPAPAIHTLNDTPDTIESDGIKQIVKLVYQLLQGS